MHKHKQSLFQVDGIMADVYAYLCFLELSKVFTMNKRQNFLKIKKRIKQRPAYSQQKRDSFLKRYPKLLGRNFFESINHQSDQGT